MGAQWIDLLDPGDPREVEVAFTAAYDKLRRAFDGLELSREVGRLWWLRRKRWI